MCWLGMQARVFAAACDRPTVRQRNLLITTGFNKSMSTWWKLIFYHAFEIDDVTRYILSYQLEYSANKDFSWQQGLQLWYRMIKHDITWHNIYLRGRTFPLKFNYLYITVYMSIPLHLLSDVQLFQWKLMEIQKSKFAQIDSLNFDYSEHSY